MLAAAVFGGGGGLSLYEEERVRRLSEDQKIESDAAAERAQAQRDAAGQWMEEQRRRLALDAAAADAAVYERSQRLRAAREMGTAEQQRRVSVDAAIDRAQEMERRVRVERARSAADGEQQRRVALNLAFETSLVIERARAQNEVTKIAEIERSRRIREDARGGGERKRKRARFFTGLLGPALSLRRIALESSSDRHGAAAPSLRRRLDEATPGDDADDENRTAVDALDEEESEIHFDAELARQLDATRDFDAFGGDFGESFEPYPGVIDGSGDGGSNASVLAAAGVLVPGGGIASRGSAASRGSGSSHSASSGAPPRRSNPNSADEFDAPAGFGSDSGEAGRLLATASFFSALSPPSIGSLMSGGDMDVEGSGSGGAGAAQPARLLSRWSR